MLLYLVSRVKAIPLGISASLTEKAAAEDCKRFQKLVMWPAAEPRSQDIPHGHAWFLGFTHPVLPLLHLVLLAPPCLLQQGNLGRVLCQFCSLQGRVKRSLEPFWQSPLVNQHSPTRTNGLLGDELCPLPLPGQGTLWVPPCVSVGS